MSVFDAPTFTPEDVASLAEVSLATIHYHAREQKRFPAPIEPNGWHYVWRREQWSAVLLELFRVCPKARKKVAFKLGLCLYQTLVTDLVSEVLQNPLKLSPVAA